MKKKYNSIEGLININVLIRRDFTKGRKYNKSGFLKYNHNLAHLAPFICMVSNKK